ncbi:radical SAM/SPASM domain-containing protein [Roseibium marinum]|uniref:Radical SAM protein with 4Fe4S-binding SPASM domain n=1 Tax=Roseibium marinum TaxID=281252 RepID=A0A2S3UPQ6_9HYPH|nr:radical SAM protein [Roseibium marinum]POF29676.1 radical SAM protein with 4Fe4S-binding SPASM domain [Roseibium marinum]
MTGHGYVTPPLAWLEHGGDTLALSRVNRRWAVLNPAAAAIIQSCGRPGATAQAIHSRFEARFGPVPGDRFVAWLDDLEATGLLVRNGQVSKTAQEPSPASYSVVHAYIEMLARCNLRCVHCFMGGAPERTEILTVREIKSIIDDLQAAGGRFVTLSGGEPVLHPDFPEIARYVTDQGLSGTVISNGTTLRPALLKLIDTLGFNLAISLDGVSDAVNKKIRGTTARRIIRVIDQALETLGPDRFTLSFTPVKSNLNEIEPLLEFVEARGIRRVNISVYEEVGRASAHASELSLSEEDRVQLMEVLFRRAIDLIGKTEIDLNDTRNILSQFIPDLCDDSVHPLWRSVRITSSGEVFPGSFGAVEHFRLGNIRETPFSDLLKSKRLSELRAMLGRRVERTPECKNCEWRQICRGGSVAAAFCATGEINAPDPHCRGYRAVFPKVAVALANRAPGPV